MSGSIFANSGGSGRVPGSILRVFYVIMMYKSRLSKLELSISVTTFKAVVALMAFMAIMAFIGFAALMACTSSLPSLPLWPEWP